MLGHYGWIMVPETIDHPDATKNNGRIYMHKRDAAKDVTLAKGDLVSFYLYVDDQGLGAERCEFEKSAESSTPRADAENSSPKIGQTGLSLSAQEFMPDPIAELTVHTDDFPLHVGLEDYEQTEKGWNTLATRMAREFAHASLEEIGQTVEGWETLASRLGRTLNAAADEFVPMSHTLLINPSYLLEAECDDELTAKEDSAGIDGDDESDYDNQESIRSNASVVDILETVSAHNPCEASEVMHLEYGNLLDNITIFATRVGDSILKDIGNEGNDTDKDTRFTGSEHSWHPSRDGDWTSDLDSRARGLSEDDSSSMWTPSDAEALDAICVPSRPPPGLSLPPWRSPSSSDRDNPESVTKSEDVPVAISSFQEHLPPWKRAANAKQQWPSQAHVPGQTLPPWRLPRKPVA
jgi:hypothetical protein